MLPNHVSEEFRTGHTIAQQLLEGSPLVQTTRISGKAFLSPAVPGARVHLYDYTSHKSLGSFATTADALGEMIAQRLAWEPKFAYRDWFEWNRTEIALLHFMTDEWMVECAQAWAEHLEVLYHGTEWFPMPVEFVRAHVGRLRAREIIC